MLRTEALQFEHYWAEAPWQKKWTRSRPCFLKIRRIEVLKKSLYLLQLDKSGEKLGVFVKLQQISTNKHGSSDHPCTLSLKARQNKALNVPCRETNEGFLSLRVEIFTNKASGSNETSEGQSKLPGKYCLCLQNPLFKPGVNSHILVEQDAHSYFVSLEIIQATSQNLCLRSDYPCRLLLVAFDRWTLSILASKAHLAL